MNDKQPSQSGAIVSDSAEHQAHIVTSATLIETLERTALHTSDDSGRAFPGICGWIVLDEVTTLRRQLGYSGLNALMDAIHQRIAENLRPGDLTARFGVDAIGLVLEPLDGERDFKQEENHIVRQISSELFEINNTSVAATVSMALRQIDETLRPAEKHLIATAEAAESLRAKGGNRAQLMTTANTSSGQSNASLLSQLTRALRDNSLKVLYQPLLSTAACSRERFQLLPRLIGSDGKMIPAARFIPIAASRGLVPAIDSWMIRQAIDLLKTHQENASESPIFFLNQSAGLIDDEKLLKWLVQEINAIDEDKRALVLEFNIDDLKSRIRSAQVVLEKIQQLGMQVSITGIDELISEPIILEHLPADYLRMKADFARRMLLSQQLGDRFSEFAGTVHSAGRKLIIPMLEDAESVARIWQMEVDLIQGNFIQQPSEMPNG